MQAKIITICLAIMVLAVAWLCIRNIVEQNEQLKVENVELRQEIEELTKDIDKINRMYLREIERLTGTYLGTFDVTFYCPTGNRTASGTWPKEGRTVATDPDLIPTGSEIRVVYQTGNSVVYKAEDIGGAIQGRSLDVFVESYDQAIQLGRQEGKVYLIKEAIK